MAVEWSRQMAVPLPANETLRVEALRGHEILDTPPDQALDDITQLAAQICGAPVALITLIDANRQWFKSNVGFPLAETAREFSFCAHAILHADEVMIVPDALADERFSVNPLVTGDPKIRFYAGLPLVTADGFALGALCVIDRVTRVLTAEQLAALHALRRSVISELELRRSAKELKRVTAALSTLNESLETSVEERTRQYTQALAQLRAQGKINDSAQAVILESEERFRTLWETTTDAVLILDNSSVIRYANPAVQDVFGYAPEELAGQPLALLQPGRLRQAHLHGLARYVSTGEKKLDWRATEAFALRRDGSEFPVEIAFSAPVLGGEQVFVGFIRDITARRLAEDKVKRLNRVYAVLSGINSLIIRVHSRQELFNEACRIAVEQGGFDSAKIGLVDQATLEVHRAAWAGHANEEVWDLKSTVREGVREGQGTFGRAIRERKPVVVHDLLDQQDVGGEARREAIKRGYRSIISLPLIVEGTATGILSILSRERNFFDEEAVQLLSELAGDISFAMEVIGKEEKLNYVAYYDALTGFPNRTLLLERLTPNIQLAKQADNPIALILIDVQRFRSVNETLGRRAGDTLLCELAQRLKSVWPDPENLARISADCFAGIVTDFREVAEIAYLLTGPVSAALRVPFVLGDNELSIAVSGGVALFPSDGQTGETLLSNAEAALKTAKNAGERYLFYQPAMNATVAQSLLLESKLRRALERDQFVLHYQPKIDIVSGSLSGLEALMRWNNPDGHLELPGGLIPVLEETGMINELGLWAMRRAMTEFGNWASAGLQPPRVAVNVSAIQLARKDFVSEVRSVLNAAGGNGTALELEITESMLMVDIQSSTDKLRAIRDMGVNITIDDFGTGHSSLAYLAKLPINALKIDRSFINGMIDDPQNMTIVASIISLAHSLNLKVVAEGVESQEQVKLLTRLKCDEMQGYIFSAPLPPDQLAKMLEDRLKN